VSEPADEDWMRRALKLAERGRGFVEPNPLVGAVVVRDGALVGEGWHQRFGGPHAEVQALQAAGEAARGATLYVTLEPCCHHGKTPPCTDAVIRAGIECVVAAMPDPFPEVAGKGFERLRAAGVTLRLGVERNAAFTLNLPYLTLLKLGRPYVHAKWAMSLDGRIATRTGDSKWISGEQSRAHAHELRGRVDAVVVGRRTVLADDPLLTARPPGPRIAARIVLTSGGILPAGCRLLQTLDAAPVIVATLAGRGAGLRDGGCEVIELPEENGRPNVSALVRELGNRRMTNILVEGGSGVLGSFHDADLIDELHVYIAPKLIGGDAALAPVGGSGLAAVGSPRRPIVARRERALGEDRYVNARLASALPDEPA
jgi:diaminohydroxyphosphoribosylaminopyrimidine deaminase / 5-amino-6-(5-phosphoribosylamino)uracil reductase